MPLDCLLPSLPCISLWLRFAHAHGWMPRFCRSALTVGARAAAAAKMPLSPASDSPKYSDTTSGPLITRKQAPASEAVAHASTVFPVPAAAARGWWWQQQPWGAMMSRDPGVGSGATEG